MAKKLPHAKILIIGATGMLGNAMLTELCRYDNYTVFGTVRKKKFLPLLPPPYLKQLYADIDITGENNLTKIVTRLKPQVIINCVGFVGPAQTEEDVQAHLLLNAVTPHRLAAIAKAHGARLIHISSDGVFRGKRGAYTESDEPDARDLYGLAKLLGEVKGKHCLTLRLSIIGHGLENHQSLVDWFLGQKKVAGFRRVIFSGLPTVEVARLIGAYIIPRPELSGLYHVAAKPISKYDLLKLISQVYNKKVVIEPRDDIIQRRVLSVQKFSEATSYQPPPWEELINNLYQYYQTNPNFIRY